MFTTSSLSMTLLGSTAGTLSLDGLSLPSEEMLALTDVAMPATDVTFADWLTGAQADAKMLNPLGAMPLTDIATETGEVTLKSLFPAVAWSGDVEEDANAVGELPIGLPGQDPTAEEEESLEGNLLFVGNAVWSEAVRNTPVVVTQDSCRDCPVNPTGNATDGSLVAEPAPFAGLRQMHGTTPGTTLAQVPLHAARGGAQIGQAPALETTPTPVPTDTMPMGAEGVTGQSVIKDGPLTNASPVAPNPIKPKTASPAQVAKQGAVASADQGNAMLVDVEPEALSPISTTRREMSDRAPIVSSSPTVRPSENLAVSHEGSTDVRDEVRPETVDRPEIASKDLSLGEGEGHSSREASLPAPTRHVGPNSAPRHLSPGGAVAWQIVESIRVSESTPSDPRPRLEVELDPPELGRLSIELTDTAKGITAKIVVHRESTLPLVEQQIETIRHSLDQAGIGVGDIQVSYQGNNLGQGNSQSFQDANAEDSLKDRNRSLQANGLGANTSAAKGRITRPISSRQVDLRV